MKLTTHLHLVPRSRVRGVIPPLPNTPSWRGAQLKAQGHLYLTCGAWKKFGNEKAFIRIFLTLYLLHDAVVKITVTFSKKNPAFLWNRKVHYRVHKSPPLDHILSQPNPVRSIDPYRPKIHLNVIIRLSLGLPSGLLPSGFTTKTL
jgi:hypothetical protein